MPPLHDAPGARQLTSVLRSCTCTAALATGDEGNGRAGDASGGGPCTDAAAIQFVRIGASVPLDHHSAGLHAAV